MHLLFCRLTFLRHRNRWSKSSSRSQLCWSEQSSSATRSAGSHLRAGSAPALKQTTERIVLSDIPSKWPKWKDGSLDYALKQTTECIILSEWSNADDRHRKPYIYADKDDLVGRLLTPKLHWLYFGLSHSDCTVKSRESMDCVLDSGCVFDPVARVYLFLHLHLAALLPEVELCPSLPCSALLCHPLPCQCHIHLWSALQSKGAPHVWDTRATGGTSEGLYMGGNYMLARKKVRVR